jgi:hypothetical protein
VGITAGKHVEIRDWGLLAVEVGQGEGAGHGRAWDLRIDIISGSNDCRIARLIGLGEECVRMEGARTRDGDYQREERLEAVVWVSGRVEGSHGRGRWVGGGGDIRGDLEGSYIAALVSGAPGDLPVRV